MTRLRAWKVIAVFVLCGPTNNAQTFTVLASFDGANGFEPGYGTLAQGANGAFYGTTIYGGANCPKYLEGNCGTAFMVTPAGVLTTLYNFCSLPFCMDGFAPTGGLALGTDEYFYGTTHFGGNGYCNHRIGCGTVFKVPPRGGPITNLVRFNTGVGGYPGDTLVQGTDGSWYGTTEAGASTACDGGCGTVFKITPDGALTTLHRFDGTDGSTPPAALVQATDGNFYGVTSGGGAHGNGTVFKISPTGAFAILYNFCAQPNCVDGREPLSALIQGEDGDLYGTTVLGGGGPGCGTGGCGTVFKITPQGTLISLHQFCLESGCPDGAEPYAGLIRGTDGTFYGTTYDGGPDGINGAGTIFAITPDGTLTTVHDFCNDPYCSDGGLPLSGLVQGTGGKFYGTTQIGGLYGGEGFGTAYSLDVGLGPFVAFVRSYGKVGQTGGILGQGFTGTTSVSLNGIPASFSVKSDTYLTATVPPGATTGYVTVMTPSGTLTSNVPFRVLQ